VAVAVGAAPHTCSVEGGPVGVGVTVCVALAVAVTVCVAVAVGDVVRVAVGAAVGGSSCSPRTATGRYDRWSSEADAVARAASRHTASAISRAPARIGASNAPTVPPVADHVVAVDRAGWPAAARASSGRETVMTLNPPAPGVIRYLGP
jgi:hypothetical protein